jgi:ribosomal protein S19
MLGFLFLVYVGNKFKKIIITEIHVGLLLSSLLITRYNDGVLHTKDKKKKKIKKNNG